MALTNRLSSLDIQRFFAEHIRAKPGLALATAIAAIGLVPGLPLCVPRHTPATSPWAKEAASQRLRMATAGISSAYRSMGSDHACPLP